MVNRFLHRIAKKKRDRASFQTHIPKKQEEESIYSISS